MSAEEVPITVWDTTAPRHFAVAGRHDVLITSQGLYVPRVVLNTADPSGSDLLGVPSATLSEIAAAEGWYRRSFRESSNEADFLAAERLAHLRNDPDVRVVDLDPSETEDATIFASEPFADRMNLDIPLGRGEAAVLAVAANREWRAGIDEYAARHIATELEVPVVTTQGWLKESVHALHLSRAEAETLYNRMRQRGFRGPPQLWDE